MAAAAIKMRGSKEPRVGRKRTSKPPKSLSLPERKFALRLAELVGDRSGEVAEKVGVTHDAVLKWLAGRSVPSLDKWPKLAAAVGLKDYRDLLPPL